MRNAGCGAERRRQAGAAIRIVDQVVRQHLDRDIPSQRHVDGAVDDAHAAAADLLDDLVA
jgi:hypothetical protein